MRLLVLADLCLEHQPAWSCLHDLPDVLVTGVE